MDKHLIIKDIKDILATFKRFDVPIYLSYGALLGAVREKDFIPWDDDVDFDVIKPIDYKTRKIVGWMLYDLGFIPQDVYFNVFNRMEPNEIGYNGDDKTGIIAMERNFKFSIFFYGEDIENTGNYICIPRVCAIPLLIIPKHFYDKPTTIKLHKEIFTTPAPQKEYLEWVYGKDWRTPIENKHAAQWRERRKQATFL